MALLDDHSTGIYQIAHALAFGALSLSSSAHQILIFPMARQMNSYQDQLIFLKKQILTSTALQLVVAGIGAALTAWVVPLVFGERYAPASGPANILFFAYAFIFSRLVLTRSLRSLGDRRVGLVGEVAYLVSFLLCLGSFIFSDSTSNETIAQAALISSFIAFLLPAAWLYIPWFHRSQGVSQ